MVTLSPSVSVASSDPWNRTSSSLTYTLTKRCRAPASVIRRDLMPGYLPSRSDRSSEMVAPLPSTLFEPLVYVRRMVGMRTSMAMAAKLLWAGKRLWTG